MAERGNPADQNVKTLRDREGKYLTFSLAGEEYGLVILKVKEIIGLMPITPVQDPFFCQRSHQSSRKSYPRGRSPVKVRYGGNDLYRKDLYHRGGDQRGSL